jgi:tetratricopeptide (TPR) repeat protein
VNHLRQAVRRELVAAVGAGRRDALLHLVGCPRCRSRIAGELADPAAGGASASDRELAVAARRVWRKIEGRVFAKAEGMARERTRAAALVAEIVVLPEAAWAEIATSRRYWRPEVVWQLLEASRVVEEPVQALALLSLAQELAGRVGEEEPRRVGAGLAVEIGCELADRLRSCNRLDSAEAQLREAARSLLPELVHARAVYCRSLAQLRRAQGRWEEALALIERAVVLFDEVDGTAELEVGAAQVEHGLTLLEAGEIGDAAAVLRNALGGATVGPETAIRARHGLAVALGRSGQGSEALEVLAMARELTAQVGDPLAQLHLRWAEGQILEACGQVKAARRRLGEVLGALLERGEDYDAAMVLLDVVSLYEAHGAGARALPRLRRARQRLAGSPALHRRARAVLDFALGLVGAGHDGAAEVLCRASNYLALARYDTEREFAPTATQVEVAWEDLDEERRRLVYRDFLGLGPLPLNGLPLRALEHYSAETLEPAAREVVTWAYEVVRRVRIRFGGERGGAAREGTQ